MSEKESKNWYLLFTVFRAEKRVKAQLDAAEIENYLPLKGCRVRWRNIRKEGLVSAISRGIFVCLSPEDFGKLAAISLLIVPADFTERCLLPAHQMDNIRILFHESNAQSVSVLANTDCAGAKVRVVSGPFQGLIGECLPAADACQVLVRIHQTVSLSVPMSLDMLEKA